ncbi:MAG: TetR/AcrR family transcriptional regulator [Solirubrobacteraceae bacterium]
MDDATPVADPPTSRQARRRERTRRALVSAMRALLAEKDVSEIRISEIAERADVGFGSFYNHFAAKEDAVEAVVAEVLETVSTSIIRRSTDAADPARAVAIAHREFIGLVWSDPRTARVLVHLDRAHSLFEAALVPRAREVLLEGVRTGRFDDRDVDTALIATVGATLALMRALLDGRLERGAEIDSATRLLLSLGVPRDDAVAIAAAPLSPRSDAG